MSILVDQNSRIIIQGINGRAGSFFAKRMQAYGNNIVGGVAPAHGGDWTLEGKVPLFDTVQECIQSTDADTTVIFVPAHSAADACFEAIDAGISNIICISSKVPMKDISIIKSSIKDRDAIFIGPSATGVFSPGKALAGIFPVNKAIEGNLGVISRVGALSYDVLQLLYENNIGVSTAVGLGDNCMTGASFVDILDLFEIDAHTDRILILGQPGNIQEELAASHILESITKPVYAYIVGKSIDPENIIGHTDMSMFDAQHRSLNKIQSLANSGVQIANRIEELPLLLKNKAG